MLTCHPDKFKTRMFPSKIVNLSLFLSSALGQLGVGPLSRLTAPASRLPPRVLSASGRRPAPTDAAAETGRWATSHRDVAAPEGEPSRCAAESLQKAKSRLPPWGRWTRVSEDGEGKLPASPSAPVAIALTGASAPVAGFFWLTPIKGKVKVVGRCPFSPAASVKR